MEERSDVCPKCDEHRDVYEWSSGATEKECPNCGYFEWIPPSPDIPE